MHRPSSGGRRVPRVARTVRKGKSHTDREGDGEYRVEQRKLRRKGARAVAEAQQRRQQLLAHPVDGRRVERRGEPEPRAAQGAGERREEHRPGDDDEHVKGEPAGERRELRGAPLAGRDAEQHPTGRRVGREHPPRLVQREAGDRAGRGRRGEEAAAYAGAQYAGRRRRAIDYGQALPLRGRLLVERGGERRQRHGGKEAPAADPLKGDSPRRACRVRPAGYLCRMMPSTADRPSATPRSAEHARILVVEDRPEVLDVLQRVLADAGYEVHTATDGDAAVAAALDLTPDLVVLDVGLPKQDGFHVTAELRRRGFRAPVLLLTVRGAVSDKVTGLEAGADDYLAKPFDYDELLARVRALLRRAAFRADEVVLRVGDLTLDPMARAVTRAGQPVPLTQKEYALLEYLVRHAGHAVTREQISEQVWKSPFDPSTNIVDVYINYLRKKLDAAGTGPLIQTVRGVGYELRAAADAEA